YPVPHEDVHHPVGVTGHEVGGLGGEDDEPAVSAHGRADAGAVGLGAALAHAHPDRLPVEPVVDEDVAHAVGVAAHEVRRVRGEGHDVPVVGDRRRGVGGGSERVGRPAAVTGGGNADPPHAVGQQTAALVGAHLGHVDVVGAVGVALGEVVGRRLEGNEVPVAGDGRELGRAVGHDVVLDADDR